MVDRYQKMTASGPGALLARRLGLPRPEILERHRPGRPVLSGPVVVDGAEGGRLTGPLRELVASLPSAASGSAGSPGSPGSPGSSGSRNATAALVFDATGITGSGGLRALHDFFHPRIRSLAPCGRVVVLGTPPEAAGGVRQAVAQRALEGFVRSVGKELRRGATAHLLLVAPGAEDAVESTLRFALSARSAYVSGQVVRIGQPVKGTAAPADWERPLEGRTAVVTGAARGIGAVVAETLARDGATVVCLDVPGQGGELRELAGRIGGDALELDITADGADGVLAEHLSARHGGVDVVVHNAGITRDKTLGRMDAAKWDSVVAVNLTAVERLTERLLETGDSGRPVLREGGRIVCTSSISGIAGNVGQTNYAASKAGLIGLVQALAPVVAGRGVTVNAVAPGFIETRMTAAVPLFVREAGRRMNSMKQGGQPVDVAEAVAYLASPGSGGVSGQVLRVCGQSLLGA
ncbi:3-oxoacyl-ACP reductase [Streptomyces radiopugnans]|uniref:3-oxoacyl-[acyl-carrier protein] reductase n=1 Tax=Streptomyces radiopugnans TaxID=403935 RepID=A0A1H9BBD8_9ACTN|nr:3-oxoacyl-ACP reductase [Streptomyces radiopugnans]SEP86021.1 3-oxoacyl-[acyl-carrier protein] reductase [Streptomyces radiopugnans]